MPEEIKLPIMVTTFYFVDGTELTVNSEDVPELMHRIVLLSEMKKEKLKCQMK